MRLLASRGSIAAGDRRRLGEHVLVAHEPHHRRGVACELLALGQEQRLGEIGDTLDHHLVAEVGRIDSGLEALIVFGSHPSSHREGGYRQIREASNATK
jgi:hypothetical protein